MKIAWLCPYPIYLLSPELQLISNGNSGHASSWITNLSNELSKRTDLELHIITFAAKVPYSQNIIKDRISFHVIKYAIPFTNKGSSLFLMNRLTLFKGFITEALAILNRIKPHLVHAHGTESAFALAAYKSNLPNIISIQGIIAEYYDYEKSLVFFLQKYIEKFTIKKNLNFGCRTSWDKSFVLRNNPYANIYYMPEALNSCFFQQQWRHHDEESLLFVGSLCKRKGIEVLLKALQHVKKEIPNVILKAVGSGNQRYVSYLEKLVKEYDIQKNVIWLGNQRSEEIARHLKKSTLFVLPTFIDNSPNSLAEAMVVGTPSIASNVGGIPSMIENDLTGILVEPNQPENLAESIIALLKDYNKQNLISKNARKVARERHLPEKVADITLDVYRKIISTKGDTL